MVSSWTVYVMSGDPKATRAKGCIMARGNSKEVARKKAARYLRVPKDKLVLVPGCRLPKIPVAWGKAHYGR